MPTVTVVALVSAVKGGGQMAGGLARPVVDTAAAAQVVLTTRAGHRGTLKSFVTINFSADLPP
jgi:ribosomal protein S5